jgi:hypothetical protein
MPIDPGIRSALSKRQRFVKSNFSYRIADEFLFEAVAGEPAIGGSLVEGEHGLELGSFTQGPLQFLGDGLGKCRQVNKIRRTRCQFSISRSLDATIVALINSLQL